MIIQQQSLDSDGKIVPKHSSEHKTTKLSFYFNDGDNWHFQLSRDSTKAELITALSDTADSITRQLNGGK